MTFALAITLMLRDVRLICCYDIHFYSACTLQYYPIYGSRYNWKIMSKEIGHRRACSHS